MARAETTAGPHGGEVTSPAAGPDAPAGPGGPAGSDVAGGSEAPASPDGPPRSEAARLVQELRVERDRALARPWVPESPSPPVERARAAEHAEMAWLHRHWAVPNSMGEAGPQAAAGRGRWRGAARYMARYVAARVAFAGLRRYLDEERELFAHVARLHEATLRELDALAGSHDEELRRIRADLLSLAAYVDGRLRGPGDAPGP